MADEQQKIRFWVELMTTQRNEYARDALEQVLSNYVGTGFEWS